MATSRENSAHSVFSIELSQHGLPRAQSAASPREAAFPGAALFGQTHLLDRLRVLCTPTSAFERQVGLLSQWSALSFVSCESQGDKHSSALWQVNHVLFALPADKPSWSSRQLCCFHSQPVRSRLGRHSRRRQ